MLLFLCVYILQVLLSLQFMWGGTDLISEMGGRSIDDSSYFKQDKSRDRIGSFKCRNSQ